MIDFISILNQNKSMSTKKSGFSLMEVLVALVILAGALMVLNTSTSASFDSIIKAEKIETISNLLQQKAVEFELRTQGKKFEELQESWSGDFGSEHPDLRWEVVIEDFPAPNLASMALQEEGQQEALLMILNKFSEHLEKAVKEMKVSVYWKANEKIEQEYSITTLLVDYEVPIGL